MTNEEKAYEIARFNREFYGEGVQAINIQKKNVMILQWTQQNGKINNSYKRKKNSLTTFVSG